MKKTYIKPTTEQKVLNPAQLICMSITEENADPNNVVLSKEREDADNEDSLW